MIFAAGLGTRLRPYTDDRPKAMVEVDGLPMIAHQLLRLRAAGFHAEEIDYKLRFTADERRAYSLGDDRIYIVRK